MAARSSAWHDAVREALEEHVRQHLRLSKLHSRDKLFIGWNIGHLALAAYQQYQQVGRLFSREGGGGAVAGWLAMRCYKMAVNGQLQTPSKVQARCASRVHTFRMHPILGGHMRGSCPCHVSACMQLPACVRRVQRTWIFLRLHARSLRRRAWRANPARSAISGCQLLVTVLLQGA